MWGPEPHTTEKHPQEQQPQTPGLHQQQGILRPQREQPGPQAPGRNQRVSLDHNTDDAEGTNKHNTPNI